MSNHIRAIRREAAANLGMKRSAATTGHANPYGTRKKTRGTFGSVLSLATQLAGGRRSMVRQLFKMMDFQKPRRAA
jgi:hypothetical protein